MLQIAEKLLAENAPAAQILDILLVEMQILDVVDQLVKACRDGIASAIGYGTEVNIEIGNAILKSGFQVTVAHRQLVKVAEHGHVQLLVGLHIHLIVSRRGLCRAL